MVNCKHCGKEYPEKGIHTHIWRMHGEGKGKTAWNKGKTKEDDATIAKSAVVLSEYNKQNNVTPPSWKGRKHTEESKKRIASAMAGNTNSPGRGNITYYNDIKMKSTWEAKTAEYLDKIGLTWKYEEECYPLSERKTYRPDFFVYEGNELVKVIEVKGYFRKENREKFELFKTQYPNVPIELWDKKVLQDKKII